MTKINPKQIRPGTDNQVLKTVGGKAVWSEASGEVYGTTNLVYNADNVTVQPDLDTIGDLTVYRGQPVGLISPAEGTDAKGDTIVRNGFTAPATKFFTFSMQNPRHMFNETGLTFSFMVSKALEYRIAFNNEESVALRALIRIDYNSGSATRAEKDFTITKSGQAILHIGSDFFSDPRYTNGAEGAVLSIEVVPVDESEMHIASGFCLYEGIIKNPEYRPPVKFLSTVDRNTANMPIQPLPIYGMVRGRVGNSAQVLSPRQIMDVLWDENRKVEQNIQYLGESNSNAWLIPEDGIYTVTATLEGVDQTKPFGLRLQLKGTNGAWSSISPVVLNSYPADARGVNVSTTQHFRKGELVSCAVQNFSDDATRLGEHNQWAHNQSYFTIARVATFGMDTQVSARPYNRLFKKVNARVNIVGSANKLMKFSFDVPEEFKGRKFKATFKFIYNYLNLNNTDKPRAVTEVYRKDWNGTSYIVDKPLFLKHTNGYHNYFELTEIYENTSTLTMLDIVLRDRDNISPSQSGSTESAVILETID